MRPQFGTLSSKVSAPDVFGRQQRQLVIRWFGLGEVFGTPEAFDAEELELLVGEGAGTAWAHIGEAWAATSLALLPWAVVHQALPAPVVCHRHTDAVCVAASLAAQSGPTADGAGVHRLPFATPGPELARALRGAGPQGAALVGGVGLLAWGDTEDAVAAECAAIDAAAADALTAPSTVGTPEADPPGRSLERERLILALRSNASRSRPSVLSIDRSLVSVADRPDVTDIARLVARVERALPFESAAGITRGAPEPDAAPPVGVSMLVAGVGLVSAGSSKTSADARGIVGSHGYRVAIELADASRADETASSPVARDVDPFIREPDRAGAILAGRVYIVTGAASGIGRDVARHLARLGAELAIADLNWDGLLQTAHDLETLGTRPVMVSGDLATEAVVDALVSSTISTFGGVDGAVLNAGVALAGEIRNLSAGDWRRSLDVNATSHFLLVKQLLPVLEAQGLGGSLVFIGSKNMFSPGAGFGAYSASKAALAQLARVVAIEAGPFGVRSNIVNPDNVFEGSSLWSPELRAQRAAVYGIPPEQLEAYYTQRNLMKVPITGTDVARAVAFLLSDEARRTTACVLTVDGGVPGVFPR